jgi:hypothetical protein
MIQNRRFYAWDLTSHGNGDRSDPWAEMPEFDATRWPPESETRPALTEIRGNAGASRTEQEAA